MPSEFTRLLLAWYKTNARHLAWRGSRDPYTIWVSEIMLQQTRVETVIPYFERWMQRFPTLEDLAQANDQEVLQVWEGLGYYARARNLHQAAKQVISIHNGKIPEDVQVLTRLPGIGRYTAGAILSLAYGLDEATLDGNIRRVLARVFNIDIPAQTPEGVTRLWETARENLPPGQAGEYNQALMDLGASVCSPRKPRCQECPICPLCQANALGIQNDRPILAGRPRVPHYVVCAAVIGRHGKVLIAQRPENGLLGGLWEFPGGKVEPGEDLPASLIREIQEELGVQISVGEELGVYRHAYTHFKITLHAFSCCLLTGEPCALESIEIRWVDLDELRDFPMGKIDRQISRYLMSFSHSDSEVSIVDCG